MTFTTKWGKLPMVILGPECKITPRFSSTRVGKWSLQRKRASVLVPWQASWQNQSRNICSDKCPAFSASLSRYSFEASRFEVFFFWGGFQGNPKRNHQPVRIPPFETIHRCPCLQQGASHDAPKSTPKNMKSLTAKHSWLPWLVGCMLSCLLGSGGAMPL